MPRDRTRRVQPDLTRLVDAIGYDFHQPALLRQALTHPSATHGRRGAAPDNYERLEFLGDRVLGLIVAEWLLSRFPAESEGSLSRRLAALVRRETLAEVASGIGLGDHLILGPGEADAGSRQNASLLADACEAVIGALYLDAGLEAARAFVVARWTPYLEADLTPPQDAKTALQEWAQGRGLPLPEYREVAREGPPHEPVFTVEVEVQEHPPAIGRGLSKRLAEQAAAERLLAHLGASGRAGEAAP